MNSDTDQQLLREYTERLSESAFAELVRRHVDFVHSAALRMLGDTHLAEDVTQSVFMALALNARQLADRSILPGWLHRTTQNLAAKTVRSDVRRRAREQEAAMMNETQSSEPDAVWGQVAPHLDNAIGELSEAERDVLLLRYFQRKSAREIAQTLGVSEDAAQKRVSRAVERLREFFAERGVTVGASGLAVVITANAVQAAPAGLAATVTATAALAGTTIAATATATATKAVAMSTLEKSLIAATLVAAIGTGIYEARQALTLRTRVEILQQQQAPLAEQIKQLQSEREDATRQLAAWRDDNERLTRNTAELVRLPGENTRLKGGLPLAEMPVPEGLSSQDELIVANAPISLRYVKLGEPGYAGERPLRTPFGGAKLPVFPLAGATFLVTNHTSKTVVANFSSIEVKVGTNWVAQMRPHGPLMFSSPGSTRIPGSTNAFIPGLTTNELKPNQAAYATIQFSGTQTASGPAPGSPVGRGMNYLAGQPTGAVWRLTVNVQEKLTGLADASARITGYPDMQRRLALNGVTNATANPFSGAYSFFGKPTRVVSQEVPTQ